MGELVLAVGFPTGLGGGDSRIAPTFRRRSADRPGLRVRRLGGMVPKGTELDEEIQRAIFASTAAHDTAAL
jgi:hypothetical protein